MCQSHCVSTAANALHSGAVIAYPTETVYGLGCLPDDDPAIERLLKIKQRAASKGLILLAANRSQLERYTATLAEADWDIIEQPQQRPTTWLVPAAKAISPLLCGEHDTIAIRITRHPVTHALCLAANSPIISTSANITGQPPTQNHTDLATGITEHIQLILIGSCGQDNQPSQIIELGSRRIIR